MKQTALLIGLTVAGLYACSDNPIDFVSSKETTITGNTCEPARLPNSPASTEIMSSLPAGSRIIMNASGGLQLTDQVFTYSGTSWTTDMPVQWQGTATAANVTALYPALGSYTQEDLYKDGLLQDILFVKGTFPAKQTIELKFKHLFSCITFHIAPELTGELQELSLTAPFRITAIDPETAEMALEAASHTAIATTNGADRCSFFVPPAADTRLELTMKTKQKSITRQLKAQDFAGNYQYTCHIKTLEKLPGIETAADLIAFAKLINKDQSYEGSKTLEDFGDTANGLTTYRLLNDITLTRAQCDELVPIGIESIEFKDEFDGQGHAIYNLTPAVDFKRSGLFGVIAEEGTVRNVCIRQAILTDTDITEAGILAGRNKGTIIDCSLQDCTLSAGRFVSYVGLLAASSYGKIINCSIREGTIQGGQTSGSATGICYGEITNCFFTGIRISGFTGYSGGICGTSPQALPCTINNCYIDCHAGSTNSFGTIIGYSKNAEANYCYYKYRSGHTSFGTTGGTKNQVQSYNDDFIANIDGKPILEKLNEWVEAHAALYPLHPLRRWTTGDANTPAAFIE